MASNFLHNEALITRVIVTESSYLVRTKRPQYGTIQAERRGHGTLLQRVIGEPSYKFSSGLSFLNIQTLIFRLQSLIKKLKHICQPTAQTGEMRRRK
jgi:hypothetical protein